MRGLLKLAASISSSGKSPDALFAGFLQGLTTNHIDGKSAVFTAFLNAQGRVITDAFVTPSLDGQELFIDCSNEAVCKVLETHLKRYNLRGHISISNVSDRYRILSSTDNDDNPYVPIAKGLDERSSDKWSRLIVDAKSSSSPFQGLTQMDLVKRGIASAPHDIIPNVSFPLESNLDLMGAINFHKGCYLGQELTIRTHHRGVTRKRIVPLWLESDSSSSSSVTATTPASSEIMEIFHPDAGERPIGKVTSRCGELALGLVRLEHAAKSGLYVRQKVEGEKKKSLKVSLRSEHLHYIPGLSAEIEKSRLPNETIIKP